MDDTMWDTESVTDLHLHLILVHFEEGNHLYRKGTVSMSGYIIGGMKPDQKCRIRQIGVPTAADTGW